MESPTPVRLPLQQNPDHLGTTLHTSLYAQPNTYEVPITVRPESTSISAIHSGHARPQPVVESPVIARTAQSTPSTTQDQPARATAQPIASDPESTRTTQSAPTTTENSPGRRNTIRGMHIFRRPVSDDTNRRFEYLMGRLAEPLAAHLRKSRHEYRPTAMRLMFLGADENSVRPWIVVLCPERVKKRAQKFFEEDIVRRVCEPNDHGGEGFQVAVVGNPPRPRGSTDPTISLGYPSDLTYMSWSTKIKSSYDGNDHYATMGGFLVATSRNSISCVYGLTTSHGITPITRDTQSVEKPWGNYSFPGSSSSDSEDENHIDDGCGTHSENKFISGGISEPKEELVWSRTGSLADVSFSRMALDRDWALIKEVHKQDFESYIYPNCQFRLGGVGDERSLSIGGPHYKNSSPRTNCVLSETSSMIIPPSGSIFMPAHILVPGKNMQRPKTTRMY